MAKHIIYRPNGDQRGQSEVTQVGRPVGFRETAGAGALPLGFLNWVHRSLPAFLRVPKAG